MMRRILVVDDEESIRKLLELILREAGYEVLFCEDGLQGYNLAKKEKPDLIILDLMLPKLDGHKVCRLLKFDTRFKEIPIIISTAKASEEDKKLAQDSGADAYLLKPFKKEELLQKIKELIKDNA
ncbi:MAG: two-component system response regulator [Candidatus Omnitrophica bacterium 4484_70.2]|nr:MAG: two-component system response regulator [Candidatus Omnitrophica bacterium 4484_70.2]